MMAGSLREEEWIGKLPVLQSPAPPEVTEEFQRNLDLYMRSRSPTSNANPLGINQYTVGIHKSYFPKHLHPKGLGESFVHTATVHALSREDAARKYWAEFGAGHLAAMKPHEGRLPRKVSVHVGVKGSITGAFGRLQPVTVNANHYQARDDLGRFVAVGGAFRKVGGETRAEHPQDVPSRHPAVSIRKDAVGHSVVEHGWVADRNSKTGVRKVETAHTSGLGMRDARRVAAAVKLRQHEAPRESPYNIGQKAREASREATGKGKEADRLGSREAHGGAARAYGRAISLRSLAADEALGRRDLEEASEHTRAIQDHGSKEAYHRMKEQGS